MRQTRSLPALLSVHGIGPIGPIGRHVAAALMVLAAFAARLALEPIFSTNHTYTLFYPVVIVAAYFFGARPAMLAAALSVAVAYWCFARPIFAWKGDFLTLAPAGFFLFTAAVSIYFITGMGRALRDLAVSQAQAEALAKSHADLFQELNERVTNHLQLVAALLQLQARDERDRTMSRALAEASARTLLISKVHRSLSGEERRTLDFDEFARQLLDATLAARGWPPLRVQVEHEGLRLPLDQATSVAVVLLECLNARLQLDTPGDLQVRLHGDQHEATLRVSESTPVGGGLSELDLRRYLIDAMVEQLGGRFSFRADGLGAVSELVFPHLADVAVVADAPAASVTLH